ncbi:hypothetical protein BASA60_000119 [Batrachochytrium salamandrivorans]|nr:hypothetical protein BASA60_000119 [Batrachochytrium salamandrivorans]
MDLFSSIGAGAKFNKARFSQDFQVFKSTKAQAKLPDQQAEDVTPELDFFNSLPNSSRESTQKEALAANAKIAAKDFEK